MNYALAKELEEAGFPQGGKGCWLLPPDNLVARRIDRVYEPTLEELIEAIGPGFFSIELHGRADNEMSGPWVAKTHTRHQDGSTPTEALAHLWLILNKKV
jgi:hypothetical protein